MSEQLKKTFRFLFLLTLISVFPVKTVLAQSVTSANDGTNTQINQTGNQYNIDGGTQIGDNLFHSFGKFGLDAGEIANFLSNPNTQNILGRVVGGNTSVIDGLIKMTGGTSNLYLINPAGIIFGPNGALDLPASFNATTANGIKIGDNWFKALGENNYTDLIGQPNAFAFTSDNPSAIINSGNLVVNSGESITLLGGQVINTGTITAEGGEITIASVPEKKLVTFSQTGSLLSLGLPTATENEVNNEQTTLTATSLPELLTGLDEQTQEATKLEVVEVDGKQVVRLIDSQIEIPNRAGVTVTSGNIDVSNPNDVGGKAYVLGDTVAVIDGNINANGEFGGGEVYLGGDYKGNGTIPNANKTVINSNSVINADALSNGNGGKVIAWADDTTIVNGTITAKGAIESGDGGFVEVSGKQNLAFNGNIDVSATNGNFGTVLFDPENITITQGGNPPNDDSELIVNSTNNNDENFTISENTLEGIKGNIELKATNDITINDLSANDGDGVLDLTTADSVKFNAGNEFTMENTNNIILVVEDLEITAGNDIRLGFINFSPELLNDDKTISSSVLQPENLASEFDNSNNSDPLGNGNITITSINGSIKELKSIVGNEIKLTAENGNINVEGLIVGGDSDALNTEQNEVITIKSGSFNATNPIEVVYTEGQEQDSLGTFETSIIVKSANLPPNDDGNRNPNPIPSNIKIKLPNDEKPRVIGDENQPISVSIELTEDIFFLIPTENADISKELIDNDDISGTQGVIFTIAFNGNGSSLVANTTFGQNIDSDETNENILNRDDEENEEAPTVAIISSSNLDNNENSQGYQYSLIDNKIVGVRAGSLLSLTFPAPEEINNNNFVITDEQLPIFLTGDDRDLEQLNFENNDRSSLFQFRVNDRQKLFGKKK